MVEGRQLLMSRVRQFKDNLKISKAISQKSQWQQGGTQLLQRVKYLYLHGFINRD